MPNISIIIAVYNAENYLHKCIESILNQTFHDFEIILINDGSNDNSGNICDEYAQKDSRFRVIHQTNGGVSRTRQTGLDNATGEYVIHADPDDWMEPDMLQSLYDKAKETDADMVICDFFRNEKDGVVEIKQCPSKLDHDTVQRELFGHLMGSCWNKLVRRKTIEIYNIQFDPELSLCEDLMFNIRLLQNQIKIEYLPKAFYHYDQINNCNSLSQKKSKNFLTYLSFMFEKFNELDLGPETYEQMIKHQWGLFLYYAYYKKILTNKEFKLLYSNFADRIIRIKSIGIKRFFVYFGCKINHNLAIILERIYIKSIKMLPFTTFNNNKTI